MQACEEFLAFVESKGGASGLTTEQRETVRMYVDLLSHAIPLNEIEMKKRKDDQEYRRAA
jgi:hypothetical protein